MSLTSYMKAKLHYVLSITIILFFFSTNAQNTKPIWTKTSKAKATAGKILNSQSTIEQADYYELDINRLKEILASAPNRNSAKESNVVVDFPNSEGNMESYRIEEASVFAADFQEMHPDMRAYVGTNVDDPSSKIRFSVTPQGLHTMSFKADKSSEFIDPVTYGASSYAIYNKRDIKSFKDPFICHVEDEISQNKQSAGKLSVINANDGILRTYELALASTVEYSNFHINLAGLSGGTDTQKKNAVKAAMVVTMTRVNGIFERDLSLTMVMVDNTNIIFLTEEDGYDNGNVNRVMLDANQTIIDNAIGSANYDIGHVFSTGGGGIAQPASSCNSGTKARGATGLSQPIGDIFDVEFVAHEMGHQYGALHTWSSTNGNCTSVEWSEFSSYEPGSGTTIMSYAGLCAPDNVQLNADDYFHQISISQIWANISSDPCDTETSTGNNAPIADAGADYTIPISTPYKLSGASSDLDGTTTHSFAWEQYDLAAFQGNFSETSVTGPLVRSRISSSPIRYIPRLEDLRFFNGSTEWEKLAAVARTINFQLTVRDNGSATDYGQTDSDGMVITVVDVGGSFSVTSQNSDGISYPVGSTQTVTWNVAGTSTGAINTSTVNIRLSIDGGETYPYLLTSTANDGSENVVLPAGISAPFCRFMVEANPSQNIFFNINEVDFAIGYTVTEECKQYNSTSNNLPIEDSTTAGIQGPTTASVINVADDGVVSSLSVTVDIEHPYISDLVVQLRHPDGSTFNTLWASNCNDEDDFEITFKDASGNVNCSFREGTTYSPSTSLNVFNELASSGNWILAVADFQPGDEGILTDWSMNMCIKTITLSTPNMVGLENLKIYPNPNRGEFTIQLSNPKSTSLNLEVFDIRGRLILERSLAHSGEFKEVINLNEAQSGIYILNVNDGTRKTSRKIVVE